MPPGLPEARTKEARSTKPEKSISFVLRSFGHSFVIRASCLSRSLKRFRELASEWIHGCCQPFSPGPKTGFFDFSLARRLQNERLEFPTELARTYGDLAHV